MSPETAIRILQEEAQAGKLDSELVMLFSRLVKDGIFDTISE